MKKLLLLAGLALSAPAALGSFSGQLKSSTDYFPYHLGEPTSDLVPYISAEFTQKRRLNKHLRLQARAFVIANPDAKTSPEKLFADLPEGFLEFKASSLKLRAGMDTINWGVVDVYSPSDMVNTIALFTPTRSFKRGAPMVELLWDERVLGLHAVYIPRQMPGLLPSTESRWMPRRFLINVYEMGTRVLLPDFIEYQYDPAQILSHALDHNAGAKLFSRLGSWDFQLTHFEGASPSPKAHPTYLEVEASVDSRDALVQSPIRISALTYRVRTTGFGAVWAREKWIYRFETAYQHTVTRDSRLQPWSWTSVAGAETNVEVGSTTMMWLAQFYYSKNPLETDNLLSSSYRLFDRTALLGTRWAVSDKLTLLLTGLYDLKGEGLFFMAGFEQKLSDSLKWSVSWRDFSAGRDGLIKTYERNDHAGMDLIYYF